MVLDRSFGQSPGMIVCFAFMVLVLMLSAMPTRISAQTTYVGAPYYPPEAEPSGPFNTVDAAIAGWSNFYKVHYGLYPPRCNYPWTPYSATGSSTVALMWLTSPTNACNGGPVGVRATTYTYDPHKSLGDPTCHCEGGNPISAGDPINLATANEFRKDLDFKHDWLTFERYYNSSINVTSTAIGTQWRHSYDRSLLLFNSNTTPTSGALPPITAVLSRDDGRQETFNKSNGVWVADPDVADRLTEVDDAQGVVTGYTVFIASSRQIENYDAAGKLQSVTDATGVGVRLAYSTSATDPAVAPAPGLLLSVTDPYGRQLNFTYDSAGRVYQIAQPDGGVLTYTYDTASGNLLAVGYPDGKSIQYSYAAIPLRGSASATALTGITDEAGSDYATISYNSAGAATQSSLAGGVQKTVVTYNGDGSTSVQYPTGITAKFTFVVSSGLFKVAAVDQPCLPACNAPFKSQSFDASGYPSSATDFNGNVTKTTYDTNGLLDQQVEAAGTISQRTTNFTWNTTLRVPLTRTVLDANGSTVSNTQWVYNTGGQTLARCDIDPTNSAATGYTCTNTGTVPAGVRRWTYTYCTAVDTTQCPIVGLMLTATGPRTDTTQTTTYSYYMASSAVNCGTPGAACYQAGDLHTITDAAGHVTTIASYDANGRATRITDANGLNTDLTYTPRGWLASRSVNGHTTRFTYMSYGAVHTITDPDGLTTTYGYDPAHRLTTITDALGNYVQYTLDAAGNKTAEQIYDASGTLHQSLSRTFNALGQLTQVMDGLNHTVFDASASGSYDANGNLVQSADALGIQRKLGYDALNRLVQTLDNYNGTDSATRNTTTGYTYDSLDRLTQLSDPSNLTTTYSYDGLGNAAGQISPDTGTTTRSFDAAGNVLTRTDAKGITATTTYDALDRPLTVSYPDSTQHITYAYDEANSVTGCSASYPIGQLTRIIENAVTTVYCYDAWGRVTQKQQITAAGTDTTAYRYTAAGRLSGIVYPSGTQVSYGRDGDGRIQSVSVTPPNGTATTVVSNVTYQPFGPVSGYTLGNGQSITRTYDANYRLTDLTSPAFTLHVARDAMGNITAIGNAPGANPATETYSYDPLYRLTGITEADGSTLESVTYNPTGDRLSKSGSGLATGNYSYNPNTHQLIAAGNAARSVDANGNTTAISQAGSSYGFGYNDRNRMAVAQLAGSTVGSYTYNALNQRVQKVANGTTQRFSYDEASQILAEYGTTNRDYIWMDGIPVANVDMQGSTSTVAYVTADQLGTPRAVADGTGNTLWQFAYQGNPWAEVQPTSTGYTYNLRFPGQYYDAETGLSDNIHRAFDSAIGGYTQVDPARYAGGQWSLYAYVNNSPLMLVDPLGLAGGPACVAKWAVAGAACGGMLGWGLGGAGGAVGGGVACTFVAPGVGTVGCGAVGGAAGSSTGAAAGAAVGGGVGGWIGNKVCSSNSTPDYTDAPGNKVPWTGVPGSTVRGGTGSRTYGGDGYPGTDRDLPHPDESGPGSDDHSHDWGRPPGGGPPTNQDRGPPRPPKPGDPPPPRGPNVPPPEA